ncbi:MAG: hypothetical protein IT563_23905 [Alphaproteobacteria bacterium]|nr:hypothetical protein [Alphaproteobacteria bacterium]
MIALASGTPNQAAAQSDDVVVDGRIITGENFQSSATMQTDQKGGYVQDAFGDVLGRKAGADGAGKPGEANGLIGLLRPADQAGITDGTLPAVQMPTDQRGGAVNQAYADLLGRSAGDGASKGGLTKVGPGTLTLGGANYGSLNGVGSTRDLFTNSRGGDQAGAHGAGGGGGTGKATYQDTHFSAAAPKAGDGSVMPTDQLTDGSNGESGLLLPAVQKVREAAARSNGASVPDAPERGGLNFANPGAAQGLNFTNSGDTKGLNFTNPGAAKGLNFTNNGNNAAGGGAGAPKSLNFTATARK